MLSSAIAPRPRLPLDVYPDRVEFSNLDGNRRRIVGVTYSATGNAAKIVYNGGKGRITYASEHPCYRVIAVAAGFLNAAENIPDLLASIRAAASVLDADACYLRYKPAKHERDAYNKRRNNAAETVCFADVLLDQLAMILRFTPERHADIPAVADAIGKAVAAIAAVDVAKGAANHAGKVAAWLASQRRETIPAVDPEYPDAITLEQLADMIPATITLEELAAMIDAA